MMKEGDKESDPVSGPALSAEHAFKPTPWPVANGGTATGRIHAGRKKAIGFKSYRMTFPDYTDTSDDP